MIKRKAKCIWNLKQTFVGEKWTGRIMINFTDG